MLDRQVVKEFLQEELEGVEIPENISFDDLSETFCKYTENDYYEWLKDNFKSFFNHRNPNWNWIKEKINYSGNQTHGIPPYKTIDIPHGDNKFNGVTPAFVIWNLLQRYTKPGDLVVDPMAGSGTTIDVAKEIEREVIGYDITPYRKDIIQNDARHIPLKDNSVDFVFIDSPYSDNVKYSEHPDCIGKISAEKEIFFEELEKVAKEICRILKSEKFMAWLIGDHWRKKSGLIPVGFKIYERLTKYFEPIDLICVGRRNQTSNTNIWHKRAREFNFYLRGFKHLFIMKKRLK